MKRAPDESQNMEVEKDGSDSPKLSDSRGFQNLLNRAHILFWPNYGCPTAKKSCDT